ncbi:hypothetical protein RHMOL_Rhmol09G0082400 [Rhododendron molle]|uniref:Uncharacterized protein n=1 Tax=Rhododendron molle TaxID=49168 RepID=A0ACC0MCF6_RHOML|nr:hypothetical protein RHMOL_Rhmol09G0082400 [Rhododendron molle]
MGSEKCIKNRTPKMRFSCERSGKYRPFVKKVDGKEVAVKKRMRSTGTKKYECPFELKAVKDNDGWTVSVHDNTHTHPPAVYLEGHSYARRLSAEQTSTVVDLSVALVKPREILTHLKVQDHENVTFIETMYNVRHKYRVIEKVGKSQMQRLLDRLEKYQYVHWTRGNETENVTELFWSPPSIGEMLCAFPRVLMMDCTYKTNKYKFPLLQIVGVTLTEMTFCAAFAFMESEKWKTTLGSWRTSVAQYEERLCVLKRDFEMVPAALEYVEKNWLVPYKERAESSHSKLKNHLENSQCNFDTIWEKIHRLMLLQVTEVKASFEKSLNSVQHDFRTTLFDRLRGVVSSNAMTLVLAASHQVGWFVESKRQCECSLRMRVRWRRRFWLTLIVCYNKFFNEENYDAKVSYVKKMQELAHSKTSSLLEPKVNAQPRGRKSTKEKNAAKEHNSTRRDPSEFENVLASLETPKPVKERPRRNLKGKAKVPAQLLICPFINQFPEAI